MAVSTFYAFVVDSTEAPFVGADLIITPSGYPTINGSGISLKSVSASTDVNGYAEIDVISSIDFRIRIPQLGMDKYLTSPASGMMSVI